MNRKEYIEKVVMLYRMKYNPSDCEIEEFRLMLDMIPDKPYLSVTPNTFSPKRIFDMTPVAYGPAIPGTTDATSITGQGSFEPSTKVCPKCGELMMFQKDIVYTSNPPMYGYKCLKCGHFEYSTEPNL